MSELSTMFIMSCWLEIGTAQRLLASSSILLMIFLVDSHSSGQLEKHLQTLRLPVCPSENDLLSSWTGVFCRALTAILSSYTKASYANPVSSNIFYDTQIE